MKFVDVIDYIGEIMYGITDLWFMRVLSVLCALYVAWLVICVLMGGK